MVNPPKNREATQFRSGSEAAKIGKNGGVASGEARRKKKALRECLEILMEKEISKDKDGNTINGAEAMAIKAFQAALKGDWKAWELCRDTSGQKPVDKVMVAEVDQSVIDEVEEMVNGTEASN